MKKHLKGTTLIAVGLLVCFSLVACKHFSNAHHDPAKFVNMVETHIDNVLDSVDVTEEQREKINLITEQIIADVEEVYGNQLEDREKIVACILLDEPDRDWLHTQVEKRSKKWTEFSHRSVDRLIEISAVLTAEQRSELMARYNKAHGANKQ